MSDAEQRAITPMEYPSSITIAPASRYTDDLARIGMVADTYAASDPFADYHESLTENSRTAQRDTLRLFSTYLAQAEVVRAADDLYHDADAWRGMSKGLLLGFRKWLLEQGYAIGTLNQRLAILRQYCRLAHEAGTIPDETYELLMTVKGYSSKTGRNLDVERTKAGKTTRKSTKKATPTPVSTSQALRLKKHTTQPKRRRRSGQDQGLDLRDQMLMGLFIEHAFRVSEVASLDIEDLNLEVGTIIVYRQKTDDTQIHRLKTHTRLAIEDYLAKTGRRSGPLLLGYRGKRITRYGLYDRVRLLGEQLGIDHLSPHDLRHYWTYDALGNGTPVDRVQSGGNWKSPTMVLKYAKRTGIANEGVMITE